MTNSLLLCFKLSLTRFCYSSSFFYINKEKKKEREPRSSVMTHLSFSVPSFFSLSFFLTEQSLCSAIKEKKKKNVKKKTDDYYVKGMRKTEKERTYIL